MFRFCVTVICSAVLLAVTASAEAHAIFKKAFDNKHSVKSTCYACHVKGKDAEGNTLGKEHRNDFGQALHMVLKPNKVTARIAEAKEADDESVKDAVYEKCTEEFLQALEQVEGQASPSGATWGELIKGGQMENVKPAE